MTVSTSEARAEYDGNGTTGPWAIPFYFLDDGDLLVIVTNEFEVETTLALTTDFSVIGAGDTDGGALTTVAEVPVGSRITIIREPDLLQQTSYPDRGPFPAKSHERALDKLTMQVQRIYDKMTRFLHIGETSQVSTDINIDALINAAVQADAAVSTAQAAAAAAVQAAASLDTSNFPEADGTRATGTWNIDITGSAAKIGGVALSALVRTINSIGPDAGGNVAISKTTVGLSNVDNTADANKSVNYAASAGYAGSAGSAPANGGNADTLDGYHYNNLPYAGTNAFVGAYTWYVGDGSEADPITAAYVRLTRANNQYIDVKVG